MHVGILKQLWEHKQVERTYKAEGAPSAPGTVHESASPGLANLAEARLSQKSSMKSGLWAGNTSASVVVSCFCRLTCGIWLQRWIDPVRVCAVSSIWASSGHCFRTGGAAKVPSTAACTSPQQWFWAETNSRDRVRSGITFQKGSVSENHSFLTSSDEDFSALLMHSTPEQMQTFRKTISLCRYLWLLRKQWGRVLVF